MHFEVAVLADYEKTPMHVAYGILSQDRNYVTRSNSSYDDLFVAIRIKHTKPEHKAALARQQQYAGACIANALNQSMLDFQSRHETAKAMARFTG